MDLPPPAQEEVAPVERSLTAEIAERCDLARAEVVDVGVTLPEGAEILSWLGDPCVPLPRLRVNFRLNGTQTSAPANPTLELWVDGPVAPADVPAGQPFVIATRFPNGATMLSAVGRTRPDFNSTGGPISA